MRGRILPKGNRDSRDKLVELISSVDNNVMCHKRGRDDKRHVLKEFPKQMKALVLHKKCTINNNVAYCSPQDNTCIECTLLGDRGLPIAGYEKALFDNTCVKRYITKSDVNLIVDNLS